MDFSVIPWDKVLEVLGFLTGLLYLWWEYHADWKMWYASMVMPFISMWIYLSKGIYADFAINVYYLVIAVYGFIAWTRHGRGHFKDSVKSPESPENSEASKKELAISHITLPMLAGCVGAFVILWGALYWLLSNLTDSTVPLPDAFTTAASIVGMWMLARKYIEQWITWILVDMVCVWLYWYKGIPFYAVLYAIYTVIAVFGYRKWLRLMPRQGTQCP